MFRKINLLFLSVFMIGVMGCSEDFLETTPTTAVAQSSAFASVENMYLVLNGLHNQMYNWSAIGSTGRRNGMSAFIPALDSSSGQMIHSARGNGWNRASAQWLSHTNANSSENHAYWYQRYHFVATSSNLINNILAQGLPLNDPDIANILGQAYAYRAWAYFRLVSVFSKGYLVGSPSTDPGVPILLEAGAPYTSGPRGTVQQVYDQINLDINAAIASFANAGPANTSSKSHLSLAAAHGIKARVALNTGDWATASSSAIAARQGYPLMGAAAWTSGFNEVDGEPEVIWGGTVIPAESNFFASYFYYISPTFNGSQNRGNPKLINEEHYDAIPATDFRTAMALPLAPNTNSSASNGLGGSAASDPNYATQAAFDAAKANVITTYGMTTAHNTHPYMHVKFLQDNPGTIDPDDVIYMRAAEMYLIEAEARTMMNDLGGARSVLSAFGNVRDTAYDPTVYTTQATLLDHIKWQWNVELFGEGHSWDAKLRWDEGIDQTNSGASAVLYQDGFMQARPSVNDAWVWKIPQAEIDANPNIGESDQN